MSCFHEELLKAPYFSLWIVKAVITQCDFLPQFFGTDAMLLCEVESDKI